LEPGRQRAGAIAVAEVEADRRRLGDLDVVVDQHRHTAVRVERQVGWRAVLALADVERLHPIGHAQLLQHPERHHRAAGDRAIEDEVGHARGLLNAASDLARLPAGVEPPKTKVGRRTRWRDGWRARWRWSPAGRAASAPAAPRPWRARGPR